MNIRDSSLPNKAYMMNDAIFSGNGMNTQQHHMQIGRDSVLDNSLTTQNDLTSKKSISHSKYDRKSLYDLQQAIKNKHITNVASFLKFVRQKAPPAESSTQSNVNSTTETVDYGHKSLNCQNGDWDLKSTSEHDKTMGPSSSQTGNSSPIRYDKHTKKLVHCTVGLSELRMSCLKVLKGHRQRPSAMDWNPTNGDLASVSREGLLIFWDTLTEFKKYAILLDCEF
ncbi:hypothetical protein RFI_05015, partial [Reticulomyxa filosa]